MEDFFVNVLYCDDIREESGGKHSFMGVYNSELVLSELPSSLPKLHAHVTVRMPLTAEIKHLGVQVCLNNEEITSLSFPDDYIGMLNTLSEEFEDSTNRGKTAVVSLEFVQMRILEEGKITLLVNANGHEVKGNGLRVRKKREDETEVAGPRKVSVAAS